VNAAKIFGRAVNPRAVCSSVCGKPLRDWLIRRTKMAVRATRADRRFTLDLDDLQLITVG
jgi:hypothetical protein